MTFVNKICLTTNAILIFFVSASPHVATADDWAFQLGAEAEEIYATKKIQIPCEQIDTLLHNNDKEGLYIAIRDAALFGTRSCDKYIKKNLASLNALEGVEDAVAFFFYKNGDPAELKSLVKSFDKDARRIGDHWTIDLFGFLDEWNVSGRRLVRHASYTHEVGAEALCSAIMWRRYLYGEKKFKYYWFKIGEEEKVGLKELKHFYDDCRIPVPQLNLKALP